MILYRENNEIILDYENGNVTRIQWGLMKPIKNGTLYTISDSLNSCLIENIDLTEFKKQDSSNYTEIELDIFLGTQGLIDYFPIYTNSWGEITGALSDQTDLQTELDSKEDNSNKSDNASLGTSDTLYPTQNAVKTYVDTAIGSLSTSLFVQATNTSPADATTQYFGSAPRGMLTTANRNLQISRVAQIITAADITISSGRAGTAEPWLMYIRVNNTVDYLIATVASTALDRVFYNSSLSISLAVNDTWEIKLVCPTWVTNPATCVTSGNIYVTI